MISQTKGEDLNNNVKGRLSTGILKIQLFSKFLHVPKSTYTVLAIYIFVLKYLMTLTSVTTVMTQMTQTNLTNLKPLITL